jgi:hypothetical protein
MSETVQIPVPLRGCWWGSQSHYAKWLPELVKKVEPFSVWCESPAGSNTNSFAVMQLGKDVVVNDASFYSHCIARGVLGREGYIETLPDVKPYEGYCTTSNKLAPLPRDVCMLIDSYAKLGNPYLNAVVGKTLATKVTYRSFAWDKTLLSKTTVPMFETWLQSSHKLLSRYVKLPRQGRLIKAYNIDWKEFIREADVKNAVLYSDFSWPWAKELGGGAGGPQLYSLFYDIGCVLKQQDIDTSRFDVWTVDNVHEKLAEYLNLVVSSGKFTTFLLSHQDKDYPPKNEITELLDMMGLRYDYIEFAVQVGFGSTKGRKSVMGEELWVIHI